MGVSFISLSLSCFTVCLLCTCSLINKFTKHTKPKILQTKCARTPCPFSLTQVLSSGSSSSHQSDSFLSFFLSSRSWRTRGSSGHSTAGWSPYRAINSASIIASWNSRRDPCSERRCLNVTIHLLSIIRPKFTKSCTKLPKGRFAPAFSILRNPLASTESSSASMPRKEGQP